jgi:glucan 1,3-beta-glucosidase
MQFQESVNLNTPRPSSLLVDGKIFTMAPPTYGNIPGDQVINVKTVANLPVFGNGVHDDTANINSIFAQNTGKVIYFPAGTYSVSNTITIPPGSRIVGDAYASYFSAIGGIFSDASTPVPLVQLGKPGDVGVGQISDMVFTVADVLPGCKLVGSLQSSSLAKEVGEG